MTNKNQITRISAYGLVFRGEDILLCRISEQVASHAGMWTLPGGGLEFGEDPKAGMIREVYEETGLTVRARELVGIHSLNLEREKLSFHGVRIIYHTEVTGGEIRFEADGTTDMCQWFPLEKVDELAVVDLVEAAMEMLPQVPRNAS